MQESITIDRLAEMRGSAVYDSAGEKIGKVEEIFYDEDTREPEWLGIGTGFLGTKRVLVPVAGASMSDDGLTVRYAKQQVKDSPDIDGDEIDEQTERALYSYYRLEGSNATPPQGDAADRDRQTGLENLDERSLTRSEEELRVGKRDVESGRVRVRKWVETEPVEAEVQLERERVHINREPIDEPVSGAQIG